MNFFMNIFLYIDLRQLRSINPDQVVDQGHGNDSDDHGEVTGSHDTQMKSRILKKNVRMLALYH